ncbi:hypothetical protein FQR65_LT18942 [Abscondita terminalis]|nr:hypothetical protein FQR65_LT18942 [Abscondita terminalis]
MYWLLRVAKKQGLNMTICTIPCHLNEKFNKNVMVINEIIKNAAMEMDVPIIDIYNIIPNDNHFFERDMLHPNIISLRMIADAIKA